MVDTTELNKAIDVTAVIVKAIGDTAEAAVTAGDVVLPILQDIGLLLPPAAVAASYLAVAIPYITDVAKYAPTVSSSMENGKPMIDAAVEVGAALLDPLHGLLSNIPGLGEAHDFFAALDVYFKANEYTPQDPRFNRVTADAS